MNFNYSHKSGCIREGAYRHFGHFDGSETGDRPVTLDIEFRMATNGIIVNTLVNDEPLITTTGGLFQR